MGESPDGPTAAWIALIAATLGIAGYLFRDVTTGQRIAVVVVALAFAVAAWRIDVLRRRDQLDVALVASGVVMVVVLAALAIGATDDGDPRRDDSATSSSTTSSTSTTLASGEDPLSDQVVLSPEGHQRADLDRWLGVSDDDASADVILGGRRLSATNGARLAWSDDDTQAACARVTDWQLSIKVGSSNHLPDDPAVMDGDHLCVETSDGQLAGLIATEVADFGDKITLTGATYS